MFIVKTAWLLELFIFIAVDPVALPNEPLWRTFKTSVTDVTGISVRPGI